MNKKGSVFGGTLLIAGSCIGAGMLGLPILNGLAGFFPSSIMFIIAWLFMTTTALLMVEVIGWFEKPVNMISMVTYTLGPFGKFFCWILYLFLFYALLVAYMSASGNHVVLFLSKYLNLSLPNWIGILFFVSLFGWIIYLGTKKVDHVNRFLMIGKIVCFLILIVFGLHHINIDFLTYWKPEYALFTFPVLIIAFGFHNLVPVLMEYMGKDRKRVRLTIYFGSIFAFGIYLLWDLTAIGILPLERILKSYQKNVDAAEAIRVYVGSNLIGYSAQGLAFFAILTSFLSQALSLSHFLSDGIKLHKAKHENVWMCFLALFPPLIFTLCYPAVFFEAINFAGGVCATVLFGVFPSMMVWIGRYNKKHLLRDRVPGGKGLLLIIFLIASFVFFYEISVMCNTILFPQPD